MLEGKLRKARIENQAFPSLKMALTTLGFMMTSMRLLYREGTRYACGVKTNLKHV